MRDGSPRRDRSAASLGRALLEFGGLAEPAHASVQDRAPRRPWPRLVTVLTCILMAAALFLAGFALARLQVDSSSQPRPPTIQAIAEGPLTSR